jgi:hypothetical protein
MSNFYISNPLYNLGASVNNLNNNINHLDETIQILSEEQENTNNRTKVCYFPLLWNEKLQLWLSNVKPQEQLNVLNPDLPPTRTSRFFYLFSMWYLQLHLRLIKNENKNIFPNWFSYSLPSLPSYILDNKHNLLMHGLYKLMLKINTKVTNNNYNVSEITDFYNSCLTGVISTNGQDWINTETNNYWSQVENDYSNDEINPTWNSRYSAPTSPADGEWRPLNVPNGNYINSWNIPWANGTGTFKTQGYATPNWGGVIGYDWHRTSSTGTNISGFPTAIQNALNEYSPQIYGSELEENMNLVLNLNGNLTPRQKFISEFWEDGYSTAKPCGKWNFLTRIFIRTLGLSENECIELLFLVNAALVNAFIVAWDVKRIYTGERPVTYLRRTTSSPFTGWKGNTEKTGTIDPTDPTQGFLPYQDPKFITPPFPGFISGHSTCSSAAATMLSLYLKTEKVPNIMVPSPVNFNKDSSIEVLNEILSNFPPYLEYDTSKYTRVFLSFKTFDDMIESAGWSRMYGGIHILPDHEAAVDIGKYLANYTYQQYLSKN